MEADRVTVSTTIEAPPDTVFGVLADPSAHAAIEGTGWVRGSVDGDHITAAGHVLRMAMYHPNHPDKDDEMANLVQCSTSRARSHGSPARHHPRAGNRASAGGSGATTSRGPAPAQTTVTLTYDRSAAPPDVREYIRFPRFGRDHLDNSLRHLPELAGHVRRP